MTQQAILKGATKFGLGTGLRLRGIQAPILGIGLIAVAVICLLLAVIMWPELLSYIKHLRFRSPIVYAPSGSKQAPDLGDIRFGVMALDLSGLWRSDPSIVFVGGAENTAGWRGFIDSIEGQEDRAYGHKA